MGEMREAEVQAFLRRLSNEELTRLQANVERLEVAGVSMPEDLLEFYQLASDDAWVDRNEKSKGSGMLAGRGSRRGAEGG